VNATKELPGVDLTTELECRRTGGLPDKQTL
jgi:hypothetical protein